MARIVGGGDIYSFGMILMFIAFVVSILIATGVINVSKFENYRHEQNAEGFVTASEGGGYLLLGIAALILIYGIFESDPTYIRVCGAISMPIVTLGFYLLGAK